MADVIEVRLPPDHKYLPLLRAAVGVLAGIELFNYDEIIQLRTAVVEAFNLASRWPEQEGASDNAEGVSMRFVVAANKLEILVLNRPGSIGQIDVESEVESCAILESLMHEVRFGGGADNGPLITMTKYNHAGTI